MKYCKKMSPKTKTKIQKIFKWTAACAILFKFSSDYVAYQKIHSSVIDAYEVTLYIQKLEQAVEQLIAYPDDEKELSNVKIEIDHVRRLTRNSTQQNSLTKITTLLHSSPVTVTATAIISEMLAVEAQILQERLHGGLVQNRELERSFFLALVLDGLLIALLLVSFYIEIRRRRKIMEDLGLSLSALRVSNMALLEEQVKRQGAVKTTVHDLKNPLGSIRGFAELLGDDSTSRESIQEFSSIIRRISQSSLELVDSLLSTHDKVSYELKPVNLVLILEEICVQNEAQAKLKGQVFIREFSVSEATVLGNRMKLEELLSNIISNAIKYSPMSGNIWVRCKIDSKNVQIEVEDQGPGFTGDDKTKAFHYAQVLSAKPTGNESSTGYGLFIVKQIAEFHKGSIEINESRTGIGACVSLLVPRLAVRNLEASP